MRSTSGYASIRCIFFHQLQLRDSIVIARLEISAQIVISRDYETGRSISKLKL